MPTEFRIKSQTFANINSNTSSYASYTLESGLRGSVCDQCKVTTELEIGTNYELRNWKFLLITGSNYSLFKKGAKFTNDFHKGGQVSLTHDKYSGATPGSYQTTTFNVVNVTDDELYITLTGTNVPVVNSATQPYYDDGSANNQSFSFLAETSPIKAVLYEYGIIENDAPTEFNSETTNSVQSYYVRLPTTGISHNGAPVGKNKAWKSGTVGFSALTSTGIKDLNSYAQGTTWNSLIIYHSFVIPFYKEGELEAIKGNAIPEEFEGLNSKKYCWRVTVYTDENNPETGRTLTFDGQQGAVGYFGESYNGEENIFTVKNLVITNLATGAPVSDVSINEDVQIVFDLEASQSGILVDQAPGDPDKNGVTIGHARLTPSEKYTYSENIWEDVFIFDAIKNTGAATKILDVQSIVYNEPSNTITCTVLTDSSYFVNNTDAEEGEEYILFITARQNSNSAGNNYKACNIVHYGQYLKNNDISGLFGVDKHEVMSLPYEYPTTDPLFSNAYANPEESLMTRFEFWIDTTKSATLESLKFFLSTDPDTADEELNEIRSYEFDLSNSVVSNNIQLIEVQDSRGYSLYDEENSQFNLAKITTLTKVGDKQYYECLIGWKVPFQEWLEYKNANKDVFYDKALSNNGLNQNAARYSTSAEAVANNYEVKTNFDAVLSVGNVKTTYRNIGNTITVYDYDQTGGATPDDYYCVIETLDKAGEPIDGNIIKDGFTQIRATFVPQQDPVVTQSVDFQQLATVGTAKGEGSRFAHGNATVLTNSLGKANRLRRGSAAVGQETNFEYFLLASNPLYPTSAGRTDAYVKALSQLQEPYGWENDQANDETSGENSDIFGYDGVSTYYTKYEAGLYSTPTASEINSNGNLNAFYGVLTNELTKYEYYQITGNMYSTTADDDVIAYVIAFNKDTNGIEHTLSLVVTGGGYVIDSRQEAKDTPDGIVDNNNASPNTPNYGTLGTANTNIQAGLVYNYGKKDSKLLNTFDSGLSREDWDTITSVGGGIDFDVIREGKTVKIQLTFKPSTSNVTLPSVGNYTSYTLNADDKTNVFLGKQQIGFAFASQDGGGFRSVTIKTPVDYYANIRVLPQLATSDNALVEATTVVTNGVPENSIIKEIDDLAYISEADFPEAGTSAFGVFYATAEVDTTKTTEGASYKLSAQIGKKDQT